MKISIGNNNKISKSTIGEKRNLVPVEKSNNIIKDLITGIAVTVIGGIILALILGMLNLPNP